MTGIYSRDASGTGPVSIVADPTIPAPGGGFFNGGFLVAADGANTAFLGGTSTGAVGIFAQINGQMLRLADRNTPGPSGQNFATFDSISISGDAVAFVTTSQQPYYQELWVYRDGALRRVVGTGDVLNGINVFSLHMDSQCLRGDTVAFSFSEINIGPQPLRGGLYTATYIPAPGTALLLAAGLAIRRRRRV